MIKTMSDRDGVIWFDGEFINWRDANIHVLTHSLHYGMGVFEGIRAYSSDRGPAIFRLDEHVSRLFQSAKIMCMVIPYTEQQVIDACIASIKENNLNSAYMRPLAFYGSEEIGLRAINNKVHLIIASWDWGKYIDKDKQQGMNTKISSFTRHHVNVSMCRSKCSGHYVNSMLALQEASNDGYDEAILLDTSGHVAEGTGENIFIIRDKQIHTPQLSSCLDGITRNTVMAIAKDMGYSTVERPITRDELYIADEAFFTGTAAEVAAIRSVDNRLIGEGSIGPITQKISETYFDVVEGKSKNPSYQKWITYSRD